MRRCGSILVAEFEAAVCTDSAAGTPSRVGCAQHGDHTSDFVLVCLKESKAGVVDEFLTVDTRPHRGEGSWAFVSKASYAIGVPPSGIAYPGLTAFTVQRSLSSRDHVLVMASRAALVPPYMASSWKPRAALTLLTLTTLPLRSAGELFRSAILEQHLRSNAGVVDHNVDLEFAGLWVREVVHCPIDNAFDAIVRLQLLGQLFGLFGRRIRGVVDDQRGALAGKILTLRGIRRRPPDWSMRFLTSLVVT
ncbi:hypothetical protein KC359_g13 [Hortaea werneckii]|nr:hypothetical protein KC359_g13 [Hortaea werneckii]